MCGIAALFSSKKIPELTKHMSQMTDLIQHRGPDDEGAHFFHDNRIALGHRRLAILDLSTAGHQPMSTHDQSLWITFNGEIYNYLEIRQELEGKGYNFATSTDTEVILYAYQEWQKEAFQKFNGMFAFILYEAASRKAIVVRDRFGVKPLYYWHSPYGLLAFASEIKQFTHLLGWQPQVNRQMAYDFLNWGVMDHTSETLFASVKQLRGGEYLEFCADNVTEMTPQKWYQLKAIPFKGTFDEAKEQFYHLMEDAVRLRLRADVDVGSCLSGGLDSSTIVCIMHKLLESQSPQRQKTFSACSEDKRFDERSFIDLVIEATKVEPHYVYPSLDQLFEECEKIVWHQDAPFSSTSIYAQWLLFKEVKEKKTKVILDGQGADEQLAGYHGFFGNKFWDLLQSWQWKKLIQEMRITKKIHSAVNPLTLLSNKLLPHSIRQPFRKLLGKSATKPSWLNCQKLQITDSDPFLNNQSKTVLHQSIQQLQQSSLPMLLHYEDRDSMAHSVESRTPFLDYRLVEFSLGLPSDFKIHNGWTKRILRESMRNILPEKIRERMDKMAFVTAEEEWMKRQAPLKFRKALEETIEVTEGIIRPSALNLFNQMVEGKTAFSYLPWRLISFGKWMQRFHMQI